MTVVALTATASSEEPAREALLIWGVQPHAQTSMQTIPPSLFVRGSMDATSRNVAGAASAIQNAIEGREARIQADLVRTSWTPEFIGKIVVTIPNPSPERIGEILDAVRNVKVDGLDIRLAGLWYRPTSSCEALAARSEAAAFETARADVAALGAALALRPKALLLKRVRNEAPPNSSNPYLCVASIPQLPLNAYAAPPAVPPARVIVEGTQIVAYSMRNAADIDPRGAGQIHAIPGIGVPDSFSQAFVHLHVQSPTLQVSSAGTALAHPILSATLLDVRVYGGTASEVAKALRADGFDALDVPQPDGSSLVGILLRGALPASIDTARNALQHALLAAGESTQIDAIQVVPFAGSCDSYRAAALAAAALEARRNDATLAKTGGYRLVRPIAIVERAMAQDVACGRAPRTTLEAMLRTNPIATFTYDREFGFIQANVEVDYEAR